MTTTTGGPALTGRAARLTPTPIHESTRCADRRVAYLGAWISAGLSVAANCLHAWGGPAGYVAFASVLPVLVLATLEIALRSSFPGWLRWPVLGVVGVAAYVVSFVHMRDLFLEWGEEPLGAWLWPVAVDGLMVASTIGVYVTRLRPDDQGVPSRGSVHMAAALRVDVDRPAAAPTRVEAPVAAVVDHPRSTCADSTTTHVDATPRPLPAPTPRPTPRPTPLHEMATTACVTPLPQPRATASTPPDADPRETVYAAWLAASTTAEPWTAARVADELDITRKAADQQIRRWRQRAARP